MKKSKKVTEAVRAKLLMDVIKRAENHFNLIVIDAACQLIGGTSDEDLLKYKEGGEEAIKILVGTTLATEVLASEKCRIVAHV